MPESISQILSEDLMADVLEEHYQAMLRGDDNTAALRRTHEAQLPILGGLLQLAQRLYHTLVPVEPSEEFVTNLKQQLVHIKDRQVNAVGRWQRWRERAELASRNFGALISVLAVVALAVRIIGSIVMVIVLITGLKKRRTTAAA